MSLIARVRSWLRVSSRRAEFEREMQDEMRTHLELYQADLRRRGVPEEEARRRALAEFGSVAARRRNAATPSACGCSTSCAATSATRSGSCADRRRSRSSPCCRSDSGSAPTRRSSRSSTPCWSRRCRSRIRSACSSSTTPAGSPAAATALRIRASSGSAITTASFPVSRRSTNGMFKVSIDGVPERVRGQYASGSYFDLLGVRAIHGRLLTPADDAEPGRGGPHGAVAVISDAFWTRRFGQGSVGAREERSGRHAVGDDRRRHTSRILRASGRRAARHHASHDARRTGPAIEAELVAERDRASRARRDRRGGARGSRGAVGRLPDGSRDASRQARLLQRHRARARGQRRERAAPHLRRAADDRDGDRRRRAPHRLRQRGQPAARPRHREAERDGGAARDWRESRQADPSAADRRRRAGVAGSRSRIAVRAVGRVVPGCGARRPRRKGGAGAAFRSARAGLYRRRVSRDGAALQPRAGIARDARRCRETRRCRWNDHAQPSRSSAGRRSSHVVGPPALRRRALSANASQPEQRSFGLRSRWRS